MLTTELLIILCISVVSVVLLMGEVKVDWLLMREVNVDWLILSSHNRGDWDIVTILLTGTVVGTFVTLFLGLLHTPLVATTVTAELDILLADEYVDIHVGSFEILVVTFVCVLLPCGDDLAVITAAPAVLFKSDPFLAGRVLVFQTLVLGEDSVGVVFKEEVPMDAIGTPEVSMYVVTGLAQAVLVCGTVEWGVVVLRGDIIGGDFMCTPGLGLSNFEVTPGLAECNFKCIPEIAISGFMCNVGLGGTVAGS